VSARGKKFAEEMLSAKFALRASVSPEQLQRERAGLERKFDAATRDLARVALLAAKFCNRKAYNTDTGETVFDETVRTVKEYT